MERYKVMPEDSRANLEEASGRQLSDVDFRRLRDSIQVTNAYNNFVASQSSADLAELREEIEDVLGSVRSRVKNGLGSKNSVTSVTDFESDAALLDTDEGEQWLTSLALKAEVEELFRDELAAMKKQLPWTNAEELISRLRAKAASVKVQKQDEAKFLSVRVGSNSAVIVYSPRNQPLVDLGFLVARISGIVPWVRSEIVGMILLGEVPQFRVPSIEVSGNDKFPIASLITLRVPVWMSVKDVGYLYNEVRSHMFVAKSLTRTRKALALVSIELGSSEPDLAEVRQVMRVRFPDLSISQSDANLRRDIRAARAGLLLKGKLGGDF